MRYSQLNNIVIDLWTKFGDLKSHRIETHSTSIYKGGFNYGLWYLGVKLYS